MHDQDVDAVIRLGELVSQFATIHRVTYLSDGITAESDTDHTVMVGVIACAVASAFDPKLNVGLIAQFSLIHDLVEAYAGDTNTFGGLTEQGNTEKEEREAAALLRIESELSSSLPWVADTIKKYEALSTPEARFVKTIDKVMPKITRLLNKRHGTDPKLFDEHCAAQLLKLKQTYGHDQDVALELYEATTVLVSEHLHARHQSAIDSAAS